MMGETDSSAQAAPVSRSHSDWRKREVGLAVRNALKLGSSLIVTWGIALVARLYIPRFLGPDRFGALNFADAFTATAFVLLGLGMDTYVRKEIAVRPEHATDFVGGILALRALLLLVVYAGMELILRLTHRNESVRYLVYIYGVAQLFIVGSTTSAGLLHATGKVNEMSVLSVITKLVWAVGITCAIVFRLGLWAFAGAFALSEGIKSSVLFWLAKRHLGFEIRVLPKATWAVLVAALPFQVSGIATTIYNRIDVSLLAFMSTDREVGWYGSATSLAGLTLLLTPLISWVLIPLFSRAAAASEGELLVMIRRSLEFILTVSIPVSLMMIVGADVWIRIAFGKAFAPAASAMSILAAAYLLMYVSIVCACGLTMLNRTWAMSLVFVSGLFVNPVCNLLLIPQGLRLGGHGGGGAACAIANLLTELVIVALLLSLLGSRTFDRRLSAMLAKSFAAAAIVIGLDISVLRPLGVVRLPIAAGAYLALVLVSGAADVRGMLGWMRLALKRRKESASSASSAPPPPGDVIVQEGPGT